MKVCFPVREDRSVDSEVYGHFGSAPMFVMVDTQTRETVAVPNPNASHERGMCNPVGALSGHEVDCVVVGGIGGGALMRLAGSGIRVFRAAARTVQENLALLDSGGLVEFGAGHTCASGGHGGGCSHG
jgi:predicted Fe-Mo cluster-binding NifX family protein